MKHIKKIISVSVVLLLVCLIIPTYSQNFKTIGSDKGTVTIQSDMPEKD